MGKVELPRIGEIVKKSNALVRGQVSIESVDGGRVLAALVSCIRAGTSSFDKDYKVNARDVLALAGHQNYSQVIKACDSLGGCFAKLEIWQGKEEPTAKITPIFSEIVYQDGVISASFNPKAAPYLLQLSEMFTEYRLLDFMGLSSVYSQRLFEILKSWDDKPEKVYSLDELHQMLDVPKSLRKDFRNFRIRVLEPAHKEMHAKTTFRYEWEAVKEGRKVVAVRFVFSSAKVKKLEAKKAEQVEAKAHERRGAEMKAAHSCFMAHGGRCSGDEQAPSVCEFCHLYLIKDKPL